METRENYDLAVIGGGPAGYVAAIKAGQQGAKVILFEKDKIGGTCLNRGCIPAKTYLHSAEIISKLEQAENYGILIEQIFSFDLGLLKSKKDEIVSNLINGVSSLLSSLGVTIINNEAKIISENKIMSGSEIFEVGSIIVCAGSSPITLPIKGIDNDGVIDSHKIFDLDEKPERLLIIGGGVIGCEIASAFKRFGSEVIIVEMQERLLPMFDDDISRAIENKFSEQGIEIYLNNSVKEIKGSKGNLEVLINNKTIYCSEVMISIGRKSNLECLGEMFSKIEIENDKIVVNSLLEASRKGIYAAGDLANTHSLAHTAIQMGEIAAINALGGNRIYNPTFVPLCVYTTPEIASVGLTEKDAKSLFGEKLLIGRFPLIANGRAVTDGAEGFVKVIADSEIGEILGFHIVGGPATELIAEVCAAIDMEDTVDNVADRMHAHPTYSEAIMEACQNALNRAIHIPNRKTK